MHKFVIILMMNIKKLLKPNLARLLITLFLGLLIFSIGVLVFNTPIFLNIGCAPNPGCPSCESCMSWGFPGIINFKALLLLLFPLYLISAVVSQLIKMDKN